MEPPFYIEWANWKAAARSANCEAVLQVFGWMKAEELRAGDVSKTDKATLRITKVHVDPRSEEVYNFEVAENHTYLVTDQGVVVHNPKEYTVQPGDRNLENVAKKHGTSVHLIQLMNEKSRFDVDIKVGEKLYIPEGEDIDWQALAEANKKGPAALRQFWRETLPPELAVVAEYQSALEGNDEPFKEMIVNYAPTKVTPERRGQLLRQFVNDRTNPTPQQVEQAVQKQVEQSGLPLDLKNAYMAALKKENHKLTQFENGYPVIRENRNKETGEVVSLDIGIGQLNDKYHSNYYRAATDWRYNLEGSFHTYQSHYRRSMRQYSAPADRARAAYSMYNGGPGKMHRWRDPSSRYHHIDDDYCDKYASEIGKSKSAVCH